MARYKFFEGTNANGSKVTICLSSFCKKSVRGIAKCNSNVDKYDQEYGKRLSQARCDEKICEKRVIRAMSRVEEAARNLEIAQAEYARMQKYLEDSQNDYIAAQDHTRNVENERR